MRKNNFFEVDLSANRVTYNYKDEKSNSEEMLEIINKTQLFNENQNRFEESEKKNESNLNLCGEKLISSNIKVQGIKFKASTLIFLPDIILIKNLINR